MDKVALAMGNFIINTLGSDMVTEVIKSVGVETVGYGVIGLIIAVILIIYFTKK
jgi:hypothetical protein